MEPITIEITILKPVSKVWEFFTEPSHITNWNFATEDWSCPTAENDLRVGGHFNYRMEQADGAFGFDYKGTYEEVVPEKKIKYHLDDNRKVEVIFEELDASTTKVTEIFEPDPSQPRQMQTEGWYAILDRFHKYVEND
ncbi:SRPBCC domain-containing protein [Kaistella polysaccharea]|uniref:SRPBCC domain-containing protein n=1 Tax=Kaistella polysaccharea TaxID=2878534 RepID=UPI001CF41F92|nr:SRPBCC domain-containing protein [Kaistella polysaccharea]